MTAKLRNRETIVDAENELDVEELVESFSPALQESYLWVSQWYKNEANRGLKSRWELGNYCNKIYEDEQENEGRRYGLRSIARLAAAVREDKSSLLLAIRFARCYTKEQRDTLCNVRRSDGTPITWSHVRVLLQVDEAEGREELLARCVSESWTVEVLQREVQAITNRGKTTKAGAPVSRPKSIDGLLSQVGAFTEKIIKRGPIWTEGTTAASVMVTDLVPEKITDKLLDDLKAKRESCVKAINELNNTKRDLELAITRATNVLNRIKVNAVDEANEEDEDVEDEYEDGAHEGAELATA